jgi:oxygen-independent coproporphyrinogen-3 oxidase
MLGLYIHIPFCRRKCHYCDFVSLSGADERIPDYLSALIREMQRYAGATISTVYIGGGTPTLLPPEQIKELFRQIRDTFNCRHLSEITFEANPESLTESRLNALKLSGVNRISMGVQSFNDLELAYLGRVHTVAEAERAFLTARKFGFSNIGFDLIYGLPCQEKSQWRESLERAVRLNPEHISLYPLTIEEGTLFGDHNVVMDEAAQAEMYELSLDFLAEHRYVQYELSNWSKPGYKCRHNLTYWQNNEYIGVGVAAASYFQGSRYKNTGCLDEYLQRVNGNTPAETEREQIDEKKRLSEEMILKLRCSNGVRLTDEMSRAFGPAIRRLLDDRLLEQSQDRILLTRSGMLLANRVMKEFV